jgi:hypothetical protein
MKYACIAGMHRSGTSVLTRALNACGIDLGDPSRMMPSKPDNPDGFFEHLDFVDLNTRLLNSFGGDWDLPPELPFGWEKSTGLETFRKEAAELLGATFTTPGLRLWKDPRNSLTLPFWLDQCPDLRVIVSVRSPLAVARSLNARGGQSLRFGLYLWETYYRAIERTAPAGHFLVTHYDAFRSSPFSELRRILDFLEIDVTRDAVHAAIAYVRTMPREQLPNDVPELDKFGARELVQLYSSLCAKAGFHCEIPDELRQPCGASPPSSEDGALQCPST